MKIFEYQAKKLFKENGLPIVQGECVETLEQAFSVSDRIGFPLVLKAQVLTGGRGKAGGVRVVENKAAFEEAFKQIKKIIIKGFTVEQIYIVPSVDILKEFYAAITIDALQGDVVFLASNQGGIEVETLSHKHPEKIFKYYFLGKKNVEQDRWQDFMNCVFPDFEDQRHAQEIFKNLCALFFKYDCLLAEINPLVIDSLGQWIALDAKVIFDENALFRNKTKMILNEEKILEKSPAESQLNFVQMKGNVGCIVNGAGLAMATLDIIKLLGGEPANFLDVGGSSHPNKIVKALQILTSHSNVKVILINIFGGITRCDDIAEGILLAMKNLMLNVPLVVRLTGTNAEKAHQLLAINNIQTYPSMKAAVREAVRLANQSV